MDLFATLRPFLVVADAGIPLIAVTWPAMVVALAPIIVMEALLIRKRIGYKPWPIFRATAVANLVSTIVGVPMTWLALVACEMFIGTAVSEIPAIQNSHSPLARVIAFVFAAAWLPPGAKSSSVLLATLVLLVPFFFVSVWSERYVMKRMLPVTNAEVVALEGEISELTLQRAVRDANVLSYGFLFAFTCAWLVWNLSHR